MFNPKPFKLSRTHFPPSHILTNIESAIVCCIFSAGVSCSPPGHFKVVESGHFLCVSRRSVLWQSAKLFSLVKQSLLGTLKTFCPVESPLSACLHVCLIVLTALIEQKKKKRKKLYCFQISKCSVREYERNPLVKLTNRNNTECLHLPVSAWPFVLLSELVLVTPGSYSVWISTCPSSSVSHPLC